MCKNLSPTKTRRGNCLVLPHTGYILGDEWGLPLPSCQSVPPVSRSFFFKEDNSDCGQGSTVWIIFFKKNCEKPVEQTDSWAVADLTHHLAYCWEHWCSQWFDSQSEGCTRDTQNYPSYRQENWHFAEVSGTHHTQNIQLKCPKKRRAQELTASNCETCLARSRQLLLAVIRGWLHLLYWWKNVHSCITSQSAEWQECTCVRGCASGYWW